MQDYLEIMGLLATDPLEAARRLDALADGLREKASQIRRALAEGGAPTSTGGMGDRARMRVAGPDGRTKQETDTGGMA